VERVTLVLLIKHNSFRNAKTSIFERFSGCLMLNVLEKGRWRLPIDFPSPFHNNRAYGVVFCTDR
jgi:hypothetical protein